MIFRFAVLCVLLAILSASLASHARVFPQLLYGKRIAGQVIDAETGRPIVGAHVAFLWESPIIPSTFTGHNSRDICYHAAAAVTDAQGRFQVPPWSKWSTYDVYLTEPTGVIYTTKYFPYVIVLQQKPGDLPNEHPDERYAMKPFNGAGSDRMHMLFWGLANHDCIYGGDSQKALYPMLKAIYEEARGTARNEEDSRIVRSIARIAAEAALARSPESEWDPSQVDMFIRENLQ